MVTQSHLLMQRLRQSLVPFAARFLSTRTACTQFSDPFPLPLEPEVAVAPSLTEFLPPLKRTNETPQTLRARLVYQSRKRGTLEADLLLSTFAAEHLKAMSVSEMNEFDKLMDEPDWDIYYWAVGKRAPPERWARSALLEKLRKHAANESKIARRMPDLTVAQE